MKGSMNLHLPTPETLRCSSYVDNLSRVILLTLLYHLVNAQDYQDYQENTPRAAPARLRPHANLVEPERTAHVAILKQINKHNEDGSYTYGYEGADGSFKIETKLATGEVKGKYGYVDETGKVRVVEYGANQYGFQPSGEGITVAPPTLVDESTREAPDYEDELVNRPQKAYRLQRPQQQTRTAPPPPPPQPAPVQPARQHIQPQYVQYVEEEEEHAPEPPRRIQYVPQSSPVPQRALQIPGGQRSTQVLYTPIGKENRPESEYSQTQTYGDGGSNFRISRPVYAPPPVNPAPTSARAHGFLAPASGGRPLLSATDFGPSTTPRPQAQAIPAQLRYYTQPQPQPQYQLQPQPQPQLQHQFQHQPQPQQLQYQPQYASQLQAQSQPRAQSQPHPQAQPQPHSMHHLQGRSGGSLLDQLARDYALPEGNAQPLHDISFGYY